jgi:hypothetical protein
MQAERRYVCQRTVGGRPRLVGEEKLSFNLQELALADEMAILMGDVLRRVDEYACVSLNRGLRVKFVKSISHNNFRVAASVAWSVDT